MEVVATTFLLLGLKKLPMSTLGCLATSEISFRRARDLSLPYSVGYLHTAGSSPDKLRGGLRSIVTRRNLSLISAEMCSGLVPWATGYT